MSRSVSERYERFDRLLFLREPVQAFLGRGTIRAVTEILRKAGCSRVLDVCCGSGVVTDRIARAGFRTTGVDASAGRIERARKKRPSAEFLVGDALHPTFDREFDAAVIVLALHEMDEAGRREVWPALRRAVAPGGIVVAADFAVTERRDFPSVVARRYVEWAERRFEKWDPDHYRNYRKFIGSGGLRGWLDSLGEEPVELREVFAGRMAVAAVPS